MAIFNFTVPVYGFDQWTGANTANTVSYPTGTTFTLNPGASLVVLNVEDDDGNPANSTDNLFADGYIDTPADGSSPSTANNDQLLTQAITVDGNTYSVGDQVELEFAFTTTTGETFWVIRIDGVNVGISGSVLPTPGTTYEVSSSADGQSTPFQDVPCFTDGALVDTATGPVPIEHLRIGDLVRTVDNGLQPILWLGSKRPSALELAFFPQLQPIVIKKGAIAPNVPNSDLEVSPNHRVVVQSDLASYLFGEEEVLVAARDLVDGQTVIKRRNATSVTYRHILLEHHEVLIVNGAPTESLYPQSKFVPAHHRLDLDLFSDPANSSFRFARPTPSAKEARLLAA